MKTKTKICFYFHFRFCFHFDFHFRFCFHFCFCFHLRSCFCFHFRFCFCFCFHFCFCFGFCFTFIFLVFFFNFTVAPLGHHTPLYLSLTRRKQCQKSCDTRFRRYAPILRYPLCGFNLANLRFVGEFIFSLILSCKFDYKIFLLCVHFFFTLLVEVSILNNRCHTLRNSLHA